MRTIAWEVYFNPLNIHEHPSFQQKMLEMQMDEDEESDDVYDEPQYKNPSQQRMKLGKSMPMLMTSFGILPLSDELMSNKNFKLWVGHTNFSISLDDATKISKVPGVEAVKFFSQYRFLIMVGKMFNTAQTKINIQTTLCTDANLIDNQTNIELDKSTREKVDNLKLDIAEKDNWIILVFPNGKIVHASADEYTKEFHEKVTLYTLTYQLFGGALFGS